MRALRQALGVVLLAAAAFSILGFGWLDARWWVPLLEDFAGALRFLIVVGSHVAAVVGGCVLLESR